MAPTDGEERVIATAQHIVRTLGTSHNVAEDMLRILSNFDGRFSAMIPRPPTNNQRLPINRELDLSPASLATGNMQERLDFAEDIVMRWDVASSQAARRSMIWDRQPVEAASYLRAVDDLQDMVEAFSVSRGDRAALDRAQSSLQLAMARLEEEFRRILIINSEPVDPDWLLDWMPGPSFRSNFDEDAHDVASCSSREHEGNEHIPVARSVTDLNFAIDLIPPNRAGDLHDIALRMVAGGYGRECRQAFTSVRKAALEQSLCRLGVEKLSIEDVQKMTWETLELKIKRWTQALKVAVRVLFASERRLSDKVFAGLRPCRETCFSELVKGVMMQLLSFGEAVAISRRSPEKLFTILDMYETLWGLIPDIDYVFSDDLCVNVRSEASGILMRLGEAARGTFAEFENAIHRDTSKTPVPGGTVHPLTRYVMNYLRFLLEYTDTLKQLLGDKKEEVPNLTGLTTKGRADNVGEDENSETDSLSPLAVQIIWLTVLLECNLDGKSKLYKDPAQTYLFLMNNMHYIVGKVKQSELASLLGDDWLRKHTGQVRQYATSYERAAWNRVLACLRVEGLSVCGSVSSGPSRVVLKERFKSFNSAFEEVYRTQSTWVVPDPRLCEELRVSIAGKLISGYRSFFGRFRNYLDTGRHPEKYIKYTPEDLENYLLDFFQGTSISTAMRKKSFATS